MEKLRVSVVIPVYNGEKTLRQCLESVLNQTYKKYEVIVVDNSSTDGTKDIIKEFEKKDKRVKYVFEKYRSRGAARNAGIREAKGEIIAMTDADCVVPKKWLKELTRPIREDNEFAVQGFQKDLIGNYWTSNIQKADKEFFERVRSGKYINHIDTKNFAIKTSILKKLRFDPKIENFDDLDFYLRVKKIAKTRFLSSLKVGHYHKNSLFEVIKTNFNRAFWTTKIYKKYKGNKEVIKELMFESISLKNFLSFPVWMFLQFIRRPIGEAFFILISEVSWRSGILWGLVLSNPKLFQSH